MGGMYRLKKKCDFRKHDFARIPDTWVKYSFIYDEFHFSDIVWTNIYRVLHRSMVNVIARTVIIDGYNKSNNKIELVPKKNNRKNETLYTSVLLSYVCVKMVDEKRK